MPEGVYDPRASATAHPYPAMRCLVPDCPLCLRHRALALAPAEADAGTLTPAALTALKGSLRAPPAAAPLSLAAHAFAFTASPGPALETPTKAGRPRTPSANARLRSPAGSSLGSAHAPSGMSRSPSGLSRSATGPTRSSPSALRTPRTKAGISRSCFAGPARTLSPARRTLGLIPLSVSRAHNLALAPAGSRAALAACVRLREVVREGEKVHGEKAAV
jgi:hypothetical protein